VKFNPRKIGIGLVVLLLAFAANARAQEKRPITFKDLISMHRVSGPQVSPDGKWVAYDVATPDYSANHLTHDVWIVAVSGGDARQLTRDGASERPRWSPDGKRLAILTSHEGVTQVYSIPAEGGESVRITTLSTGADDELWSPDGKWIAFVSSVYPDCRDDACNSARDAAAAKNPVKAHVAEKLLYRHWNAWSDGKRSHLFVVPAEGGAARG